MFTRAAVVVPPGRQVQASDAGAPDEPVPVRNGFEGVSRDRCDAGVVADDPGDGGRGQSGSLAPSEDARILVPQPERLEFNEIQLLYELITVKIRYISKV